MPEPQRNGRLSVILAPRRYESEDVVKTEGEAGWTKLVQIMEMSKDKWAAQFEDEDGDDEDESEVETDGEGALERDDVEEEDL